MLIGFTDMQVTIESYREKIPVEHAHRFECRDLARTEDAYRALAEMLRNFGPTVMSLQFDPLMFRAGKFFVFSMLRFRRSLPRQIPLLVTVHETADVLLAGTTMRKPFLQKFREWECAFGLRWMRAKRYFASTDAHVRTLSDLGLLVEQLPIVNNIPRVADAEIMKPAGLEDGADIALFFGRIDPVWNASPVLDSLRQEYGRNLAIVSVGEVGYHAAGWERLEALAADIPCFKMGFMSAEALSGWLSHARVGVATTSFTLWLKSGSCAAMIEHELPLVFAPEPTSDDIAWPPKFAMPSGDGLRWFEPPLTQQAQSASPKTIWSRMFGEQKAAAGGLA